MADREAETQEDDFSISENLIPSPTHKTAETRELDFDGLLQPSLLRLHEDLSEGNGGVAWPAGVVLTKYLLRKKRDELKNSSMSVCLVEYMHLQTANHLGVVWSKCDQTGQASPAICINYLCFRCTGLDQEVAS